MSEHINPYTSDKKKPKIMELYKKGNFPKSGETPKKVNLATADELDKVSLATRMDFAKKLSKKYTTTLSNVTITIPSDCRHVELLPLSSLNIFDTSNPGKSIRDEKFLQDFESRLEKTETGVEKVVVFAGDLFGWQWKMSELTKADITDDNKVLWFGINLRQKEIIKITKRLLKSDAHIVFMRGAQENNIMKVLDGRDVIQEIIDTLKTDEKLDTSKLYYVNEGVQEIVQFERVNSKGKLMHYPVELRTNNALSKATSVSGYLAASIKNNGPKFPNVFSIDFNGNVTGLIDADHYSMSSVKVYNETPKGKKPTLASKTHDELTLTLEDDGTISKTYGGSMFLETPDPAELKLAEQLERNRCLYDLVESKIKDDKIKVYETITKRK